MLPKWESKKFLANVPISFHPLVIVFETLYRYIKSKTKYVIHYFFKILTVCMGFTRKRLQLYLIFTPDFLIYHYSHILLKMLSPRYLKWRRLILNITALCTIRYTQSTFFTTPFKRMYPLQSWTFSTLTVKHFMFNCTIGKYYNGI